MFPMAISPQPDYVCDGILEKRLLHRETNGFNDSLNDSENVEYLNEGVRYLFIQNRYLDTGKNTILYQRIVSTSFNQ